MVDAEKPPSLWEGASHYVMTFVEGIQFAINPHTVFMLMVTVLCTFCCAKGVLDFSFDTSMSIVAVGTIFPLVFSVQARFVSHSFFGCDGTISEFPVD
jgi:hypothetical protein